MQFIKNKILYKLIVLIFIISFNVNSQLLGYLIDRILTNDESINSSKYLIKKANNDLSSVFSSYTPKLDLTIPIGREILINNDSANTDYDFYEFTAKISQNIFDFGATSTKVNKAQNQLELAQVAKDNTKSNKIYEAVSAYLGYIKAYKILEFAKKSEARIREVTNLENEKVARGGGLASNVLQSKAKLAGAKSTRVRFEGNLSVASNRFYNIFRELPKNFNSFRRPKLPLDLLPNSELEAIKLAKKNNISLNLSKLSVKNAEANIKGSKSKFYPSVKAIAEYKNKRNVSGLDGTEIDQTIKLEMKYPISIGGPYGLFYKENADYKSSVNQYMISKYSYDQLERNLEESIRNAWQTKNIAKQNYEHLNNQANISGEFFDLAMKEVKIGNRQLIDILSSETAYINAKSSAEGAKTEYELAVYQLLLAMGILDEKLFINKDAKNLKNNNLNHKLTKKTNAKSHYIKSIPIIKTQNKLDNTLTIPKTINQKIEVNKIIKEKKIKFKKLNTDKNALIKVQTKLDNSLKIPEVTNQKIENTDTINKKEIKLRELNTKNNNVTKNNLPINLIKKNINLDLSSNKKNKHISEFYKDSNQKDIKEDNNEQYKIQLGAFSKLDNAKNFIDKYENKFPESYLIDIEIDNNEKFYKIKSLKTYSKDNAMSKCKIFLEYAYNCILSKI